MSEQRQRAKDARKGGGTASVELFAAVSAANGPTIFLGDDSYVLEATVLAVTDDSLVLDQTPFYAESGGQVGDTGVITSPTGRARIIETTYGAPGVVRHQFEVLEGDIEVGQTVTAVIDGERRDAIRRNHTATHLLHWALRETLGDHVKQQGSLVGPDRLRFDFSHYDALSDDEIVAIEDLVAADILANAPARHFETTKDQAEALGAIAFFGDKYGDVVKVLEAGPHSVELCGGTHVKALGDIGPVKIVSEASIGSNIRRIEAVSGTGPLERLREDERRIRAAADAMGVATDELVDAVERRVAEVKDLRARIRDLERQAAAGRSGELAEQAIDGIVIARVDGLDREAVRDLAVAVRDRAGIKAVVLGSAPEGGGVAIVAAVAADSGFNASELIADAAKKVKGGGGKSADLAVAGGKDPEALDDALDLVRAAVLS
jgi:alanyl-tRNA synthetase